MKILGIACDFHDSSACLLNDGDIIVACDEERFTRNKHDSSFPINAIDYCLKRANTERNEIDYVAFYEKPIRKFERILQDVVKSYPFSFQLFRKSIQTWFSSKLWIKSRIIETLGTPAERIFFTEHHQSHAASSFFCSPFSQAAILTIDGVGESETTTISEAKIENGSYRLKKLKSLAYPDSLGLLYSTFTSFLGFHVNEGEYKVMGMAAYGEPKYLGEIDKVASLGNNGALSLSPAFFCFDRAARIPYSKRFISLFGPARKDEGQKQGIAQKYFDIAASIQLFCENVVLDMAKYARELTNCDYLCISGGCGLNGLANSKVALESGFKSVYIQPAAGDSGGSIGAAKLIYHTINASAPKCSFHNVYLGPEYSDEEIRTALQAYSFNVAYYDTPSLISHVSTRLFSGSTVGWFQGRMEWGPRALGNRSILANPSITDIKDILNMKIKFREEFRPFAPSVLEEFAADFFDIASIKDQYPLRYMQYVVSVKKEHRDRLPGITHNDGTARVQIVRRTDNPLYYDLIQSFYSLSKLPILINTSFNLKGEPIVNCPADAINTFMKSSLDLLVLGNYLVEKR